MKLSISEIDVKLAALKGKMDSIVGRMDERSKKNVVELKTEFDGLTRQRAKMEADAAERYAPKAPVIVPDMGTGDPVTRARGDGGASYRSMFPGTADNTQTDFRDFSDFVDVVASGRADPRLQTRAMTGAVPSDGGFSLDVQFEKWLMDESLGSEVIRNLPGIKIQPMTSRTVRIPAFDTTDLSAGGLGGQIGYWTGENSSSTESDPKMRMIELHARKLTILSAASLEVCEDGESFGQQIQGAMGKTMGHYLDGAFIRGDGAGKPLGLLNSPCRIEVAAEAAQVADTIVVENISKMYSRLTPSAMRRGVWLANPDTLPQLYSGLTVAVGTGGSWVNVFSENSGDFFLMGRPLYFSDHMSTVGDAGDLAFIDPSAYAIGVLGGSMRFDISDHVGFSSSQRYFRAACRVDGQCLVEDAITPAQGTNTFSPVVTLAAR